MSSKQLSEWYQSVLPDHYQQITSQILKYQDFLRAQLPAAIADTVQVINLTNEHIVISASSAQVTNYLRLHTRELQQQFHETFAINQVLIFKTIPTNLLLIKPRQIIKKPHPVMAETIDHINNNAKWIANEKLKLALQSLARELKNRWLLPNQKDGLI